MKKKDIVRGAPWFSLGFGDSGLRAKLFSAFPKVGNSGKGIRGHSPYFTAGSGEGGSHTPSPEKLGVPMMFLIQFKKPKF